MSLFTGLIAQWIIRRVLELGGIAGALLTAWGNLPPATQEAILALLGARWQEISLGTLISVGVALWGYVWSFLSTVKPQVVTADKKQIALPKDSVAQAKVEVIAKSAPKPRTLWDRLTGK